MPSTSGSLLKPYIALTRLNKPIGIYLLLWPTVWALWLASAGHPPLKLLCIFITGVVLMRSAGCVFNDITDRHLDGLVDRTKTRPLVSGALSLKQAFVTFFVLIGLSFLLLLPLPLYTGFLAVIGLGLAMLYPFLKRITHLPQLGLGLAFSWGIPMAFSAITHQIPLPAWTLFFSTLIWVVIYDSLYAMADREYDIKAGIKSTAILFGTRDNHIIGLLQLIFIASFMLIGHLFQLHLSYYISLIIATCLFIYQQRLIKDRSPEQCIKAFLNNHWVGGVIFIGIASSYLQ